MMSYLMKPSKSSYTSQEMKGKGLVQTLAIRRRPQASPLPSRHSSLTYIVPHKTCKTIVRRKSTSFTPEYESYRPYYGSQALLECSRTSAPQERIAPLKDYLDDYPGVDEYEDGVMFVEDGSTILVARPLTLRDLGRTKSSDLAGGKQLNRALSVGALRDLRKGYQNEPVDEDTGRGNLYRSDVYGLTMALRLDSHLRHLRKILFLYKEFDESSEAIYIPATHNEFFYIIHDCFLEFFPVLQDLNSWAEQVRSGLSGRTYQLIETAYAVVGVWRDHAEWITKVSDRKIRDARDDGIRVKLPVWMKRQSECKESTRSMLKMLEYELEEGMEGIDDLRGKVQKGWRENARVGTAERQAKGWHYTAL